MQQQASNNAATRLSLRVLPFSKSSLDPNINIKR